MPIECEMASPHRIGETDQTWSYCDGFGYSLSQKTLSLVYFVYANGASAYQGGQPIGRREIRITGDDYDALIAQHAALFAAVQAAVDQYAVEQPDFAGGVVVPPGPPSEG